MIIQIFHSFTARNEQGEYGVILANLSFHPVSADAHCPRAPPLHIPCVDNDLHLLGNGVQGEPRESVLVVLSNLTQHTLEVFPIVGRREGGREEGREGVREEGTAQRRKVRERGGWKDG